MKLPLIQRTEFKLNRPVSVQSQNLTLTSQIWLKKKPGIGVNVQNSMDWQGLH